ncbi:recombination mediator RecR [Desulfococcaceae bacterium HSG9]|nr:recombination mediator RecR [Desulfococcaceae bacterium HSG9]
MHHYPASIRNLIKNITKLPGIGVKTAERLVLHILHAPHKEAEALAQSILELKSRIRSCRRCFGLSDTEICTICSNPNRVTSIVCVVEQPGDMAVIEKSGGFTGLYHILQGVLSPMDGVGPDDIRIKELMDKITYDPTHAPIEEIILATATNVEGEATASYIAKLLENHPVKVTRIASGVPIGSDLKYVDQMTMQRALRTRYVIK